MWYISIVVFQILFSVKCPMSQMFSPKSVCNFDSQFQKIKIPKVQEVYVHKLLTSIPPLNFRFFRNQVFRVRVHNIKVS